MLSLGKALGNTTILGGGDKFSYLHDTRPMYSETFLNRAHIGPAFVFSTTG